jgi:hypothetical protein
MERQPGEGQSAKAHTAAAGLPGSAVWKSAWTPIMTSDEEPKPARVERRASYRIAVDGPRRAGRMRIAGRDLAVTIVDESTGGFGVESPEAPACQIGDTLLLEIAGAWVEVRVIRIDASRPEAADHDAALPGTRLGLARVRDVEDWELNTVKLPVFSWAGVRSLLRPLTPLGSSLKGTIAMIAAMIVVGIGLIVVLENFAPVAEAMRDPAHESISAPRTARDPLARLPAVKKTAQGETAEPPQSKTKDEAPPETASDKRSLPALPTLDLQNETVRRAVRAAQPDFLLRPDVIERLALNDEQVAKIEQLLKELRAAIATLGTDGPAESDARLVQFGARAWEVLTDEQRQLFAALYTPGQPAPQRAVAPPISPPAAQDTKPAA